jgi:glyoxylase-like metal-dependent hydrolase (beta-lactamase superfamily II)
MRILDGIYQLLTPFPQLTFEQATAIRHNGHSRPPGVRGLPYVLPYLIASRGDTLLVDCGWNTPEAHSALRAGFSEHGHSLSELSKLVITHVHPDHYGMAGRLKADSGCDVIVHERDAEVIHERYLNPGPLVEQTRKFLLGQGVAPAAAAAMAEGSMGMIDKVSAVPPDTRVTGGETIRVGGFEFQVIWTPGHSPGHICLYEPNHRLLVSGDHLLPGITPNVSVLANTRGSPLGDFLRSIAAISRLDVRLVLPAHEYEFEWFQRRLVEIQDHHEARLDELERLVDSGGSTAWQVTNRVHWASGKVADLEPRLQRSALGETVAHLEHLSRLGRLNKVDRDGMSVWLRGAVPGGRTLTQEGGIGEPLTGA